DRIFFGTLGSIFNGSTSIPHINISLFASKGTLSYTKKDYLRQGSEVLLEDMGKPVIVKRRYGQGLIIWCGFNFPYHTIVTGNREERKLLVALFKMIYSNEDDGTQVRRKRNDPESIELILDQPSNRSHFLLVKETYFPPWRAYDENGRPLKIYENQWSRMLVKLEPQTRTVKLRYEWDSVVLLPRILSLAGIVLSFVIPFVRTKFLRLHGTHKSKENVE
ncbi:MAG: hypothetical protein AYL31_010340, partial [Candidatus Bathyarchaeota archaeon B26-1]